MMSSDSYIHSSCWPSRLNAQTRHGRAAAAGAQVVEGLWVGVDVAHVDVDAGFVEEIAYARAIGAARKVVQRVAFAHERTVTARCVRASIHAEPRAERYTAAPDSEANGVRAWRKSKSDKRLVTIRNGVIAFVALIVVVVGRLRLFRSTAIDVSGEFVEGTHYKVIDGTSRACGRSDPRDRVLFVRLHALPQLRSDRERLAAATRRRTCCSNAIPLSFSPQWELLAQAYFALQSVNALDENHERIFKAIHDNGKQFLTADMIADFVDGHGVTREAFLAAFNSPATARALADASRARERALRVNSVPYLTVADHYAINMDTVPRKKAFDVVDFLIAKIRAERAAQTAARGSVTAA